MTKLKEITIPDETIISRIYRIRAQKVILDRDLAEFYDLETRILKQVVRRNKKRFPDDFMFEMSREELEAWMLQNANTGTPSLKLRRSPLCFTEQGITMLSCILNNERAIHLNIQIVRIYAKIRELTLIHGDVYLRIEHLEQQLNSQIEKIDLLFSYLDRFIEKESSPRNPIGFKRRAEKQ